MLTETIHNPNLFMFWFIPLLLLKFLYKKIVAENNKCIIALACRNMLICCKIFSGELAVGLFFTIPHHAWSFYI